MDRSSDKFRYVCSCDLKSRVRIKIGTLQGQIKRPDYEKLLEDPMLKFCGSYQSNKCAELCVKCVICSDGHPLVLPMYTSYKAFSTRWDWNEWIIFPVEYRDLPRNSIIALTIFDCCGPSRTIPIGGTTISLFGKLGVFRQGMMDLKVWPDQEADGNFPGKTPGKGPAQNGTKGEEDKDSKDMRRLNKLKKKYENKQIPPVDWLDRLTFREIEIFSEKEKQKSDFMYLNVAFPQGNHDGLQVSVIYYDMDGDFMQEYVARPQVVKVPDYEISKDNLVESKHHMLARSLRSGMSDKDLKPDAILRDKLNLIVSYPLTKHLAAEEKDLIWKYRFYLSDQKKALTKFLKCVNWDVEPESRQALQLLDQWSPMDPEDALELLGKNFTHPTVRCYAVNRLKQAPDEDLILYLLQLVQALKYENFDDIRRGMEALQNSSNTASQSSLNTNENNRPERSSVSSLNTYYDTKLESSGSSDHVDKELYYSTSEITESAIPQKLIYVGEPKEIAVSCDNDSQMDLTTFLISRACNNWQLCNYFFWYVHVECSDPPDQDPNQKTVPTPIKIMYRNILRRFLLALVRCGKEGQRQKCVLSRQLLFVDKLYSLLKLVEKESGSRLKKIEKLKEFLHDTELLKYNFENFTEPLPFLLDPEVEITGIIPEEATLFKSALMPCRLSFKTTTGSKYIAIYKYGDDLRQDQLILQIIALKDKLLRRENWDLRLTPYRVLATSVKTGFVQFIDALPVSEVLNNDGNIQNFFRKHHPLESGPCGVHPDVMQNYIKSLAGYCVITYILGVGDRHLDNLLLTTSGKIFHIDFGYILGRDPKPLPPPMKLSKEMIEALCGIQSEHFHEFRKGCYMAILNLRKNSNLILNLFSLMVDANVPDIALEPDKVVKKVEDKFMLHLSEELAVQHLQTVIDDSITFFGTIVEQIHKVAQYWRR